MSERWNDLKTKVVTAFMRVSPLAATTVTFPRSARFTAVTVEKGRDWKEAEVNENWVLVPTGATVEIYGRLGDLEIKDYRGRDDYFPGATVKDREGNRVSVDLEKPKTRTLTGIEIKYVGE